MCYVVLLNIFFRKILNLSQKKKIEKTTLSTHIGSSSISSLYNYYYFNCYNIQCTI